MRRYAAVAGAILVIVLWASPALALRDPFQPVIAPNATTAPATGTGAVSQPEAPPPGPVRSETLSNTGSDVIPWAAVGIGLMAVGVGALYAVRQYRKPLV
ncbi:MAG: hypothetical protein ACRDI3_07785 [Actinomycetota bacterium]